MADDATAAADAALVAAARRLRAEREAVEARNRMLEQLASRRTGELADAVRELAYGAVE